MERQKVYAAIDSERDYQNRQKELPDSHVVAEFPLSSAMEAIRYNLEKANRSWYIEKSPYPQSMDFIRKIAALCVQMGERYGMDNRR